jgi:hypothetical protein
VLIGPLANDSTKNVAANAANATERWHGGNDEKYDGRREWRGHARYGGNAKSVMLSFSILFVLTPNIRINEPNGRARWGRSW